MSALPRATERIVLRRLLPSDLPTFQAYRHDEEVGLYQGWQPQSDPEAAQFITQMGCAVLFSPGEWIQLAIADRITNQLLGDAGIRVSVGSQQAEIGFTLSASAQGRGLATEAVAEVIRLIFEHTPVRKIVATTDARNLPCIRLVERLGMERRDTVSAEFRGESCFEHVYDLQRP